MHVQLNESNKDKMLKLSGMTNKSVNELVNIIIQAIDCIKIINILDIGISDKLSKSGRREKIIYKDNWVIKL